MSAMVIQGLSVEILSPDNRTTIVNPWIRFSRTIGDHNSKPVDKASLAKSTIYESLREIFIPETIEPHNSKPVDKASLAKSTIYENLWEILTKSVSVHASIRSLVKHRKPARFFP